MGIEFTLRRDDPRVHVAARLRVVCPRHPDEGIVDICMNAIDDERWAANLRGYRQEMVGVRLSQEAIEAALPLLDLPVQSEDAYATDEHIRAHLECARTSCNYHGQVRDERGEADSFYERSVAALKAMRGAGIAEMTVTDVDQVHWRVVGTPDPPEAVN